ncbi:AAA family ATPase [Desulfosporosinus sp.]|uniref:AAA family ATPase n=1 Tax=Desulfosporosinus sp. TaxID=157907 RepID=UPI0025C55784|nr:AAA family ATPase [Desulfosporosinus sp.]MBC2726219.1 hypothetical protein [Desulfosporosinus sp.]
MDGICAEWHQKGVKPLVIIDESQELDVPMLSELRLVLNYQTDSFSPFTIILAGKPKLTETLCSQVCVFGKGLPFTTAYHCSTNMDPIIESTYIREVTKDILDFIAAFGSFLIWNGFLGAIFVIIVVRKQGGSYLGRAGLWPNNLVFSLNH